MIKIPAPVSANRYWRIYNGKMVRCSIADAYKKLVRIAARNSGVLVPLSGPVELVMQYHPKMNKDGSASKTRLDLDNTLKVTLDALNGVAYLDDKQITRLSIELAGPVKDGGMTVWVTPVQEIALWP